MDEYAVLVTGATGFIGSYLCKKLSEIGFRVKGTYRNIKKINSISNIDWIEVSDVGPKTDWSEALNGVDYVIHLASVAHRARKEQVADYEEFMRINAYGTLNLVEQCKKYSQIKRFIYLSSVSAVCSYSREPINENKVPKPDTYYGLSKLKAETFIKRTLQDNPDYCILRPPLVYGRSNPGNMARLIKLVKKGIPLPFGQLNNKRSFVFVGNLVDIITKIIDHPLASNRTYFVSDGIDLSTKELIYCLSLCMKKKVLIFPFPTLVLRILGKIGDAMFLFKDSPIGSYSIERLVGSLIIDSNLIRKELSWVPPYTVVEGLNSMFDQSLA